MIGDAILLGFGAVLSGIASLLPTANIPSDWYDSMAYLFTVLAQWNGLFPISSLVVAALTAVAIESVIFSLRLLGVGIALVRGVRVLR